DETAFRADLEAALQGMALHELNLLLGRHAAADWLEPLRDSWQTACAWFRHDGSDHPLLALTEWPDWSAPDLSLLAPLRSLAPWLLTDGGQGSWRKPGGINRKLGFPTEKDWPGHDIKAAKERFAQQLEHLAAQDGLDEALRAI